MDPTKLQALLEKANANLEAKAEEITKLTTQFGELKGKHDGLLKTVKELEENGDVKAAKEALAKVEELQEELSDVRTKMNKPVTGILPEEQKNAFRNIAKKAIGQFIKEKKDQNFFEYIKEKAELQCKTLNISSPETGGLAVAEILARDVLDYYRDLSPIVSEVGRKASMTRDFRQLIRVSWPSVAAGIEAVAGVVPAETSTEEYVEVRSKEFKMYAQPRITNEALAGVDIDIYSDLVSALGEEMGVYLANQILYGDGQDKNCRGILSSNRVDITDNTGESFKPTLAPDPTNARNSDFFPVFPTGVDGSMGADDKSKVDFILTFVRKLPKRYRANAKLYMNENTLLELEKIRDADEKPIFRTTYMEGEPMINGKPVVIDDTLPDIASDSFFMMYGDLPRAFVINDGDVDQMLLDPYTKKGNLIVYQEKEMFEMIQNSDAILIACATTNSGA